MARRKRGSLLYLTKEGFKNVWSNRLMSFASISVLLSCLVVIGVAFMAVVNMNSMMENIEDQNVIMVFVQDDIGENATKQVGYDLSEIDNVKECTFVPKEQSFKEQIKNIGTEASLFEGIENPLPDAYKVTLSHQENFDETVSAIKEVTNVMSVRENKGLAEQMSNIRTTVSYVSLGVILVLLFISLFIISNTVRITMFSRRLEIRIMKSVGATRWFIRWPFMVEGMVLGIVAGIVSIGLVGGIYYLIVKSFGNMIEFLFRDGFINFMDYFWILFGAFLIIGIFAGVFGSAISINKYLKEQEYETDEK